MVVASTAFEEMVKIKKIPMGRKPISTLQVNVGKLCNQACLHCHVEAGPKKIKENMSKASFEKLYELIQSSPDIRAVDLTGGAPEMNENFRWFVSNVRALGVQVIDRCNLTILSEPGQEDTAQFLADHQVEVVASLPCYSKENVEKQRGRGVFGKSIDGLQKLNSLGYGKPGSGLILNLVYNPGGAFLPPPQEQLQRDYKKQLLEDFEIEFNGLFTITNMPIKRFLWDLQRQGKLEEYMQLLLDNFNPVAAENVMCRDLVSISWDGYIYDCDFNQMLDMDIGDQRTSLQEIQSFKELEARPIFLKDHCYGCTAGAGSSCGGSLVDG